MLLCEQFGDSFLHSRIADLINRGLRVLHYCICVLDLANVVHLEVSETDENSTVRRTGSLY